MLLVTFVHLLCEVNEQIETILEQRIYRFIRKDTQDYYKKNNIEKPNLDYVLAKYVQSQTRVRFFSICLALADNNVKDATEFYKTWHVVEVYRVYTERLAINYEIKRQ